MNIGIVFYFLGWVLGIEGILLLHDVIEPLIAHNHGIQNIVRIICKVILLQYGHSLSRRNKYFS